MIVYLSKGR